jgi:hypothetical protein
MRVAAAALVESTGFRAHEGVAAHVCGDLLDSQKRITPEAVAA